MSAVSSGVFGQARRSGVFELALGEGTENGRLAAGLPIDPFFNDGWSVIAQLDQQVAGVMSSDQGGEVLSFDESLLGHVVKEPKEPGIIMLHIKKSAGL